MGNSNKEISLPDLVLDYTKLYDANGTPVVPAIILEEGSPPPLMVGFMNREAFEVSRANGLATFWKRTEQRLWTKGETSGNSLIIQKWLPDCDNDTLAVWARRLGPACHRGTVSCFDQPEDGTLKEDL